MEKSLPARFRAQLFEKWEEQMRYEEKMNLLKLEKEKVALRLKRITEKEKTLKSVARKAARDEDTKRKFVLGGLVFAAMRECEIFEFEDEEILGALIKVYETISPTTRAVCKKFGSEILYKNRHKDQQSASAQGFTQVEVLAESGV